MVELSELLYTRVEFCEAWPSKVHGVSKRDFIGRWPAYPIGYAITAVIRVHARSRWLFNLGYPPSLIKALTLSFSFVYKTAIHSVYLVQAGNLK